MSGPVVMSSDHCDPTPTPPLRHVCTYQAGYICVAVSIVPRNLIQPHKFYCNGSLIVLSCHALLVLPLSHGQLLVSVGQDDHNMLNVWKWKDGRILASSRGHTDKVRVLGR